MAFIKLPNICENYIVRFIKFSQLIGKYKPPNILNGTKFCFYNIIII